MKRITYIFVFFFLSYFVMAQDVSNIIPQIKDAIVTVYAHDENGTTFASGSGFFISSSGLCVTNFHVLQGAYGGRVKLTNGQEFSIKAIVDFNSKFDLVKFSINHNSVEGFPYLMCQQNLPAQGSVVISYSNPLGSFENTVSTGIISAIRDYNNYERVLQITAPISHGSSGSPVMNIKGEVVGIATFGIETGQSLNFAVSVQQLQKMNRKLDIPVSRMCQSKMETPLIRKGCALAKQGKYAEAIDCFDRVIEQDSLNHLALYYRGLWKCRTISPAAGLFDLLTACRLDTMQYDYFSMAGGYFKNYILDRNRRNGEHIPEEIVSVTSSLYMRCFELDPYRADAYAGLGYLLVYIAYDWNNSEVYNDALVYLNKAIELMPNEVTYIMYRADLYDKLGNWGMEILDCNRAIAIDDKFYRPYFCRGMVRAIELGQYEEGIMDLIIADSLVPEGDIFNKSEINAMIASAYYKKYIFGINRANTDLINAKKYAKVAYDLNPSAENRMQLDQINALL